jgi:hypothetical protein
MVPKTDRLWSLASLITISHHLVSKIIVDIVITAAIAILDTQRTSPALFQILQLESASEADQSAVNQVSLYLVDQLSTISDLCLTILLTYS